MFRKALLGSGLMGLYSTGSAIYRSSLTYNTLDSHRNVIPTTKSIAVVYYQLPFCPVIRKFTIELADVYRNKTAEPEDNDPEAKIYENLDDKILNILYKNQKYPGINIVSAKKHYAPPPIMPSYYKMHVCQKHDSSNTTSIKRWCSKIYIPYLATFTTTFYNNGIFGDSDKSTNYDTNTESDT